MARLSTHVLDTARGKPAIGMRVRLYLCEPRKLRKDIFTDEDGRAKLSGGALPPGVYELVFSVGDYFDLPDQELPFLGEVVVRFGVSHAAGKYHVPLLVTPHGYTTYKGS